jgi:hypothetical protein
MTEYAEIDANTHPYEAFKKGLLVYMTDFLEGRAVIPEPKGTRMALDPHVTWDRVRDFLTERGIRAEMEGPFFLKEDATPFLTWPDAVVYIRFLDEDQEAVWSIDLEEEFNIGDAICDMIHALRDHRWTLKEFRAICGAHPGEHRVVRIDQFDTSKPFPQPRYAKADHNS